MREATRTWLIISVGLLLSLFVVTSFAAYQTIDQLETGAVSIRHSRSVLETLDRLVGCVKDAETGQRGYLLTGNADYLAPYRTAQTTQHDEIDRITVLTADNPAQKAQVAKLTELVSAKFEELSKSVALQKDGQVEAALQLVRTDDGHRLMQQIQSIANQLDEDIRESMAEQKWGRDNVFRSASFSVVMIGAVALITLILFVRLLLKSVPAPRDRPSSSGVANLSGNPGTA
jgi:methyl-accepting chemotaxis protein